MYVKIAGRWVGWCGARLCRYPRGAERLPLGVPELVGWVGERLGWWVCGDRVAGGGGAG